jgi:hypothetical protein
MAVIAKRAGKPAVEGPLWARNWSAFGKAFDEAQLGDVLVFRRAESSGHVGLYVGEDYGAYHVLGGNQSDGCRWRGNHHPDRPGPLHCLAPADLPQGACDRQAGAIGRQRGAIRQRGLTGHHLHEPATARVSCGLFNGEMTWKN